MPRNRMLRGCVLGLAPALVLAAGIISPRAAAAPPGPLIPLAGPVTTAPAPGPPIDDFELTDAAWVAAQHQIWLVADAARVAAETPPPPPTEPAATPRPPSVPSTPGALTDEQLDRLGFCESTNRYDVNTGNGFYGRVQWLRATWDAASARAGYPEWSGVRPDLVPPEVQDAVTRYWWSASNPHGQWPVCSWRV